MSDTYDNYADINITVQGHENLNTYTELDPENNIVITPGPPAQGTKVDWTVANRNIAASVYKTYPAGTFGDFTHRFKTLCSARSNRYSAIAGVWGLSAGLYGAYTLQGIINNGGFALFWYGDDTKPNLLRLSQYGPILGVNSVALNLNVEYDITITRSGTNLTCVIKDPSGATVDTLSLTGLVTTTWNTIMTYYSYFNTGSSATTTGYDKNLQLY